MLRCRPGHAGVADMVLKDRVALVTGGGTGIGLAIALAFLREGARVTIGSRNPVHLKEGSEAARAAGHAVLTLQLDVTDPASGRSAVDTDMARQGITETAAGLGVSAEEFRRHAVKAIPIQRMIEASEVGDLAVYLASPRAAGMTGQALNICGGATAGAGS